MGAFIFEEVLADIFKGAEFSGHPLSENWALLRCLKLSHPQMHQKSLVIFETGFNASLNTRTAQSSEVGLKESGSFFRGQIRHSHFMNGASWGNGVIPTLSKCATQQWSEPVCGGRPNHPPPNEVNRREFFVDFNGSRMETHL